MRWIALTLAVLVCCGGAEKSSTNEARNKPRLQHPGHCASGVGPPGAAGADAMSGSPCPRAVSTEPAVKPQPANPQSVKRKHPPITKKLLEDAATVLLRFRQTTGRFCPTQDEQRELMVGTESLELLTRYVLYTCGQTSGWTFIHSNPRTSSVVTVILHNGCTVVFMRGVAGRPPRSPVVALPWLERAFRRRKNRCLLHTAEAVGLGPLNLGAFQGQGRHVLHHGWIQVA